MINTSTITNCETPFPAVQGLAFSPLLKKIQIKNIYQQWSGESIEEIKHKAQTNPYSLRIGLPKIDDQLRQDSVYLILSYLSYNPITKDIENREIIPYRNTNKVYIGQSPDEYKYNDYKLFVDGTVIAKDILLSQNNQSIQQTINHLVNKIEKLQSEINELKSELKPQTIYK